jgi:16S rRNA (guanine527-N7)-methyltransferase
VTGDLREQIQARANAAAIRVDPESLERLRIYIDRLSVWNRRVNLTGFDLTVPSDEAIDRLLIEPLAAAQCLARLNGYIEWLDLGSGGGSPAIPMKIVMPSLALTMVEARERKSAFLREVSRALGLDGINVVTARFEELSGSRCDIVTVRAVRLDENSLDAARNLLRPGGLLLAFQSAPEQLQPAGFEELAVYRLLSNRDSWLHIFRR